MTKRRKGSKIATRKQPKLIATPPFRKASPIATNAATNVNTGTTPLGKPRNKLPLSLARSAAVTAGRLPGQPPSATLARGVSLQPSKIATNANTPNLWVPTPSTPTQKQLRKAADTSKF